jgi:hypothetical protein
MLPQSYTVLEVGHASDCITHTLFYDNESLYLKHTTAYWYDTNSLLPETPTDTQTQGK